MAEIMKRYKPWQFKPVESLAKQYERQLRTDSEEVKSGQAQRLNEALWLANEWMWDKSIYDSWRPRNWKDPRKKQQSGV
jgi:hypothetical protein